MLPDVPMSPMDVLILSNGPGEVATWVRPAVKALRQHQPDPEHLRISVVLSPCANASGREAEIARSIPGVDRVQGPKHFYPFLLSGQTAAAWDWHPQGVVLFLGGDQFYPLLIGKRLGYRIVIYAEWEARWHRWVDQFGCMKPEIREKARPALRHKFEVIGDLMADLDPNTTEQEAIRTELGLTAETPLMGLMPGSKKTKLELGMPFLLAVADRLQQTHPTARFVIPVAPSMKVATLAEYGDARKNPFVDLIGGTTGDLQQPPHQRPFIKTTQGTEVILWTSQPAYDLMSQFTLCLTTVGANTAELGSLGVPMIVLLPTQKMDVMKAWDGIPGVLANLPGVGNSFAKLINYLVLSQVLRRGKHFAWPNIWAGREIVPELIGRITPDQVAQTAGQYLDHPQTLEAIRHNLRQVRGQPGAAAKLADLVLNLTQVKT